ncbi:MAG: hypothetical protein Q4E22_03020, partial [Coriobacteriia bacterium]|nr:hypothetical protein [Coriobacteriia bacterium]
MSSFSKNIWRSIKGHISRFLALFAIVALGAGVFAGLRMFVPDMIHSADTIYDEDRLIDFRIVSTLGIVEEDVEAVLETDGVEGAKPIILNEIALANPEKSLQISLEGIDMEQVRDFEAALAKASSETEQTRIKEEQFPNYVNRLTLLDGRFPQNPGEIVISNTDNNVQVGDNFSVTQVVGQDSIDKYLKVKKFEIVGIIKSPEFILDDYGVSPDTGKTITNYAYTGFNTYKETDV